MGKKSYPWTLFFYMLYKEWLWNYTLLYICMNVWSIFPEMQVKHFQMEGEMERKENYLESEKLVLFLSNHCLNLNTISEYNVKWAPLQASTHLCEENVMTNDCKRTSLFLQRLWSIYFNSMLIWQNKFLKLTERLINKIDFFLILVFHILIKPM